MIVVVDFGIGNFVNVRKVFGGVIMSDFYVIEGVEKIVFLGVGNFGVVMEKLELFRGVIIDVINDGKFLLGICFGF